MPSVIALINIQAHHAEMIAVMDKRVTASISLAMSRRLVICDERRDMGEPPICWENVDRQDRICIKTGY